MSYFLNIARPWDFDRSVFERDSRRWPQLAFLVGTAFSLQSLAHFAFNHERDLQGKQV